MTKFKLGAALVVALSVGSAPVAFAQSATGGANQGTTLGGSAKDNSASGGSEASGTSAARGGAMASKGSMMKSSTKKSKHSMKKGAM